MPFIGKQGTNSNSKITKYVTTVGVAGEDEFSVSVNTGSDEVQVFLNGVLLKETTDYTLSDTLVTLGSNAVENDIVEIHVYRSFILADAVKASGDTMTGELEVPTVKLSSNIIKASDGGSTITLDTSDNVTIAGDLKVGAVKASDGTAGISIADSTGRITVTETNPSITLGSNATLPDGTMCGFTETTTTPTGSQGTDTDYTTLTGSSVDYTPVSGSSFVVYSYQFGFTGLDNNPLLYWGSYYDGGIIANMESGFYFAYGDGNAGSGYMQITFTLPSWSGSKNLHIEYRVNSSSSEARLHQSVYPSDNYIKIFRTTYSVM